jgi:hypothetical protein
VRLIFKRLKLRWNASLRKWVGYLGSILFHPIFGLLAQRNTKKERWEGKLLRSVYVINAMSKRPWNWFSLASFFAVDIFILHSWREHDLADPMQLSGYKNWNSLLISLVVLLISKLVGWN